jgi:hypothetical protein
MRNGSRNGSDRGPYRDRLEPDHGTGSNDKISPAGLKRKLKKQVRRRRYKEEFLSWPYAVRVTVAGSVAIAISALVGASVEWVVDRNSLDNPPMRDAQAAPQPPLHERDLHPGRRAPVDPVGNATRNGIDPGSEIAIGRHPKVGRLPMVSRPSSRRHVNRGSFLPLKPAVRAAAASVDNALNAPLLEPLVMPLLDGDLDAMGIVNRTVSTYVAFRNGIGHVLLL